MRRSRLFHALLTIAAFFAVWLVSEHAHASSETIANKAPLCDARGAITFAPPPQMQDAEVSLDVDLFSLDLGECFAPSSPRATRHVKSGRGPAPIDGVSASREPLARATAVEVARATSERVPAPDASRSCSRPGHRSTVDRPPRS